MRKQVYQKRRARLRSLLIFCTAAAILLALLLRTDRLIRPELCAVCESETKQFAAGLMADSVSEVLQQEQFQYSDFAALTYDNSGNVTAVETKTTICRLRSIRACSTTWSNAGMRHSPFLSELHPACGFLPVTDRRSQFAFCLSVTPR